MKMGNFQELLEKNLSREELEEVNREVTLEAKALRTMQRNLKEALEDFMKTNNIGFNEAVARLGSTPRQISQIQKGVANLRLSTIAHLSAMLGQTPMIMFKKK